MMAVWLAYALLSGALISMACWLLERLAREVRFPTRAIWAAGMAAMLLIPAASILPDLRTAAALRPSLPAGAALQAPSPNAGPPSAQGMLAGLLNRVEGVMVALELRVLEATERFSAWDPPLPAIWGAASAFLAGTVAHAARRLNRPPCRSGRSSV